MPQRNGATRTRTDSRAKREEYRASSARTSARIATEIELDPESFAGSDCFDNRTTPGEKGGKPARASAVDLSAVVIDAPGVQLLLQRDTLLAAVNPKPDDTFCNVCTSAFHCTVAPYSRYRNASSNCQEIRISDNRPLLPIN